ncbi:Eukaryotic translation initiation factor 3 subunit A [Mycena venus]|uniref:Eukaryotic translation initiation factor 3 subunit A n=1 Tax=Mycena venus TaxID=2733690 RepID=A0A8H7CFF2_9AGAR|nr:Eukaryotic translation initiation factor 3 subunit A [Mycena venus]
MAPFSKPETVLKQAEGLVSVGQTHAALQSLTEMFSSKRFRSTPLASLEPIMHRFVELCVDMRKGRTAKEGLMQYKNIAQNTSVQSIEAVITRFVQLADQKVREAQEKAAVQVAVDVDDLEASETPESILLGAVSGDQSKDRTDRALVTPWLKFLWESYRTSLETLKNNARLEVIYQTIAQQAFKFCLKHNRKVEFRRLCETLRLHLSNVAKYSHQPHSINLADPETLQHHLDTRFAQLNTSVELELWQEAFRSVEDVHNLLTLAGAGGKAGKERAARPAMMANYYEKLTRIFLMSGNALYHAAAWGRYNAVYAQAQAAAAASSTGKTQPPSAEEAARLAGQVLISALAVPVGLLSPSSSQNNSSGSSSADPAATRLTTLLGLPKPPTRASLLADALARDVLRRAPKVVTQLYTVLEVEFDPLTLCERVAPLLAELRQSEVYSVYVSLLERAVLSRLLSQLAQVYASVKIDFVMALVAPLRAAAAAEEKPDETPETSEAAKGAKATTAFFSPSSVESYIMGCARRGELSVRVDHAAGSIAFVDDPFVDALEGSAAASAAPGEKNKTDAAVQPSVADLVRTRLGSVARCLHNAIEALGPAAAPSAEDDEAARKEEQARFALLAADVQKERKALKLRRALVARRRELLSELSVRREKEDALRRAESSRREKEDEAKRAREEARRREVERVRKIQDDMKIQDAERYKAALVEKGILKPGDQAQLASLDTEGLIGMQVAQLEKEKKELSERLRIVAKRVDHIERAYRKDERPLLAQDYEQQQATDRETFATIQTARKEAARRAHEEDLETKKRLARMLPDYEKRRAVVIAKKGEEYAKRKDAASRKIEEEKAKRRKAVMAKREEERRAIEEAKRKEQERIEEERRLEAERLAEEDRRRAEEEAAAAAAEAAKREAEEKAQALRKAREAERAEALEKARLQQQREEEAEARRIARLAEKSAPPVRKPIVPNPPSGVRAPAAAPATEGVWRRGGGSGTPVPSTPVTPTRAGTLASSTPPRAESPEPGRRAQIRSRRATWRCTRRRQQLARQVRLGWWARRCARARCVPRTRSSRRKGGASKRRRRLPDGAGEEGRVAASERTGVKLRFRTANLLSCRL